LKFVFCVHNHQPVGNFLNVIEEAFDRSYEPFLKRLYAHPKVKFSYHSTGYLLDWLVKHKPAYIDMLREMVSRGQVEMVGGGYYEPVIAVIPFDDRIGQLKMMNERIESLFGKVPRGIWLAERVWDPTLPATIEAAGLEYVVVDDYHFVKSGLNAEELKGYYVTEDVGKKTMVFPGSERLRYLIPFEKPEKLHEFFSAKRQKGGIAVFADDGEKFGVWPNTYKWVYENGWFEGFLSVLESGVVETASFSACLDTAEPEGRVYLPTTSYMEMGEWALPPSASREYAVLREEVKARHDGERMLRYMQGGMWRNFFAKYSEADWIHKRMLMASEAVNAAKKAKTYDEARKFLYMAQSNDPYWHGVFGGLYLPHLRTAAYENIIKAEELAVREGSEPFTETVDLDLDTHDEIIIRTPKLNMFFSPRRGGSLVELDFRPASVNVMNVLSRYYEGYHEKLKHGNTSTVMDSTKSIHDMVLVKEEGLEKKLVYDNARRASLRQYFLGMNESLDNFRSSAVVDGAGFFDALHDYTLTDTGVEFTKDGEVFGLPVRVVKKIEVTKDDSFDVLCSALPKGKGSVEALMALEFNFCMPGCAGPVCAYEIDGVDGVDRNLASSGVAEGINTVSLIDGYAKIKITLKADKPFTLWRYPIETVSLSEAGFERIYQGSSVVLTSRVSLSENSNANLKVSIRIESL